MTDLIPEAGQRSHRIRWIIEDKNGVTPDNPNWNGISDNIRTFEWEPDATIEPQRGLGSADPQSHFPGPEQHSLSLVYDLQQEFVDSNGDVVDLSAMGMIRTNDETLSGSISMLGREDKENDRQFTVVKGAYLDSVEIDGNAGESQPIQPNISIMAEKVRQYDVKQPLSGEQLIAAKSDDSADTTQTLTLENEGAGKTATISLSGTTLQSSSTKLGDVDAVELDAETEGNISVFYNQGTQGSPTEDRKIVEIKGKVFYQNVGDLGVPTLGSGDMSETVSGDFFRFQGSSVERPASENLGEEIESVNLTIENNLNIVPKIDDITQNVFEESRDISFTATVYGRAEMAGQVLEHLGNVEDDVVWDLGDPPGKITVQAAHMTDPPTSTKEEGQGVMMIDVGFSGQGLSLT